MRSNVALLILCVGLAAFCCLSCGKSGPSYAIPITSTHDLSEDHPVSVFNNALRLRKPIVLVFTAQSR